MVKRTFVFLAALAALLAAAAPARAADPPRWVAAIYVEAQRAVGLRWMAVPGATYKVLRSETAGSGYQEIAAPAQPQHFDTTVEPGSTYHYVLQSVVGGAASENSEQKSVTIPGQKAKKLAAPTWAKITPQESTEFGKTTYKVGLVWNQVPGAVAYNLYRSLAPGKDREMVSSVSETQYVDATVEVGKTYYYALTALDGSFTETPFSAEEKAVIELKKKEEAEKAKIKLKPAGRASKKLWSKVRGDENDEFDYWEPYDIEYSPDSKTVIAGSTNTHEVYVLNAATGKLAAKFGSRGAEPGQFLELLGIGLDADDNILACDRKGKKIAVFSQSGKVVREFKPDLPGSYKAKYPEGPTPMDAAADFKTGDIYFADSTSGMVVVLDEKGKFQRFIGEKGTPEEMRSPMYLRFDKDNNLVVLDLASTKISTFDREGKLLSRWGINKPTVDGFVFIGPFDFDDAGNLAVLDRSSNTLRGYLPDSRYLYNLANENNDGAAELYLPKAVAIDAKNQTVFVAEGLINRIQAFKMTGPIPAPQAEVGQGE